MHAYLHRKERDLSNAEYWYRRAERAVGQGSLDWQWESIVSWLLRVACNVCLSLHSWKLSSLAVCSHASLNNS